MAKERTVWESVGLGLFRSALRLLPGWLRARSGDAMIDVFRQRQRESMESGGRAALVLLWFRELGGVVRSAVVSRAGGEFRDSVWRDVLVGWRALVRRPGVFLVAVITVGLGVGASTAMFSVVDTLLVRPLPYPDADRLVKVSPTNPSWRDQPALSALWREGRFAGVEWEEWRRAQTSFEAVAGFGGGRFTLTAEDLPPVELNVGRVTPGTLSLFGARPLHGRLFSAEDAGLDLVILSHDLWSTRYGSDPDVVGGTVRLTDEPYTVIGVLPRGFQLPIPADDPALYVPLDPGEVHRDNHSILAYGRLAPGVTPERAETESGAILTAHAPEDHSQHTAWVVPVQEDVVRSVRRPVLILLGASLLLLVVALGNVAAILLGRGIEREGELGVRRALGAARGRLVRQLLTESAVIGALGALVGVGIAGAGVALLLDLAPAGFPGLERVAVDGRALSVALLLATGGTLLFGLFPAISQSRIDVRTVLRSARAGSRRSGRLQAGVVVAELALATILLGGAGLLTRTLLELNRTDPGFDTNSVIAVDASVSLLYQRQRSVDPANATSALRVYVQEVVEALEGLPQVERVAASSDMPLGYARANNYVWPLDRDLPEDERPVAERRAVTAGYFETLGIPILHGRAIRDSDDRPDATPVVVISEGLAGSLWPGQDAVGRAIGLWAGEFRVVGVAANLRDESLVSESEQAFYVPMHKISITPTNFLVRTSGDVATLAPAIRDRIWAVDADVPIRSIRPMAELRAEAMSGEQYRARLMMVFAALAGLLSLMGVYGVTSRAVARRRREMGIRMALGAARTGIRRLVLIQAGRIGAVGVALGLAGVLVTGRFLEGLLYGVSSDDPLTLVTVALLVLAAVLAASWSPARRATRVDPVESLRME